MEYQTNERPSSQQKILLPNPIFLYDSLLIDNFPIAMLFVVFEFSHIFGFAGIEEGAFYKKKKRQK